MNEYNLNQFLAAGREFNYLGSRGGTVGASTITASTVGVPGMVRKTTLTLSSVALALNDDSDETWGSTLLWTAPEGIISVLGSVGRALSFTTTSTIASTLNASKTVQFGFGTAAASATTLATTMINLGPGTGQTVPTFTSSATINVAATAVSTFLKVPAIFDGSSTPMPCYINIAVATADDIDADATLTLSGTFVLYWIDVGDTA